MDDADPKLRPVLELELFSNGDPGFFPCEGVDAVAAFLFNASSDGARSVLESTVQ